MSEILSVEVGDQFESVESLTRFEVIKIWFEFSFPEQRWETSVTWSDMHSVGNNLHSAKGREFVKTLHDGGFVKVSGSEEISFSVATTAPASPPLPPVSSIDLKRKQWEDDFRKHAVRYDLSPSDLGRKIRLGRGKSRNYTIVGAKPRNWKMPILIEGKRGGVYKITVESAKKGLV